MRGMALSALPENLDQPLAIQAGANTLVAQCQAVDRARDQRRQPPSIL